MDWDGAWVDAQGRTAPENVIVSYRGPEHCDWQSAVFLSVGWPLGTARPTSTGTRLYVRDAEGLFPELLLSSFEDDAELPRAARFTGYRRHGAELWISSTDVDRRVYVVRGDDVESWPRAARVFACA